MISSSVLVAESYVDVCPSQCREPLTTFKHKNQALRGFDSLDFYAFKRKSEFLTTSLESRGWRGQMKKDYNVVASRCTVSYLDSLTIEDQLVHAYCEQASSAKPDFHLSSLHFLSLWHLSQTFSSIFARNFFYLFESEIF
jgi:hypothetical protein